MPEIILGQTVALYGVVSSIQGENREGAYKTVTVQLRDGQGVFTNQSNLIDFGHAAASALSEMLANGEIQIADVNQDLIDAVEANGKDAPVVVTNDTSQNKAQTGPDENKAINEAEIKA